MLRSSMACVHSLERMLIKLALASQLFFDGRQHIQRFDGRWYIQRFIENTKTILNLLEPVCIHT